MDYKAEQVTEKESLSLLYEHTNEFICINDSSFKILIENKIKKISFYILFEYTEKYPDEPPIYTIVESNNLSKFLKKNVETKIFETIESNLGYNMIYNIVENIRTYILEDVEEKSMYDEMIERQPKSLEENMNENSDDNKKNDINYDNVLELKELCEEKYRVTEEEFNVWRKEFYKDIFNTINNSCNLDNPTGKELFQKGKINLLDSESDEDDVKWDNEKLFCDIDLDY